MRIAAVDRDRLRDAVRGLQLSTQHAHLLVARREVAIEVEPDLADSGDVRVARQLLERIEIGVAGVLRIVRVTPAAASTAPGWRAASATAARFRALTPSVRIIATPASRARVDRGIESAGSGVELAVVDVAVGVDKAHRYAERRASPSGVSIFRKSGSAAPQRVPGSGRRAAQPASSTAPARPR